MDIALEMARTALSLGEVPVGCAVLHATTGRCLSRAHNLTNRLSDPLAHAELLCARELLRDGWNLREVVFYITIEPCAMCGGILEKEGTRIIFGFHNEIFGMRRILKRSFGECVEDRRCIEIFKEFYASEGRLRA